MKQDTIITSNYKRRVLETTEKYKITIFGLIFILIGLFFTLLSAYCELADFQRRSDLAGPAPSQNEKVERQPQFKEEPPNLSGPERDTTTNLGQHGKNEAANHVQTEPEPQQPPELSSGYYQSDQRKLPHEKVLIEFLKHVGLAFFSIGVISVFLELPHWREYFERRLANVVVDDVYLEQLSIPRIRDLQIKTWKRLYEGAPIEQEGSFFQFFEERIKPHIGSPYREDVIERMYIKDRPDRSYDYTTSVSYTCRQVQNQLQSKVGWIPERGEFIEVYDVEIELELKDGPPPVQPIQIDPLSVIDEPPQMGNKQDWQPAVTDDNRRYIFGRDLLLKYYSKVGLKGDAGRDPDGSQGPQRPQPDTGGPDQLPCSPTTPARNLTTSHIEVPLKAFNDYDNLYVKVTGKGRIPSSGFIGWGMGHITKGFTLVCSYPDNVTVRHELFGLDPGDVEVEQEGNILTISCTREKWVLEGAGIAVGILPKPLTSGTG